MENKNQPTFPVNLYKELTEDVKDGFKAFQEYNPTGLTKREYFSAMAMQSFIQKCEPAKNEKGESKPNYELIAGCSVDMADAILKALETPKQ